ncbi:unnamed protein product [Thelazia callipaeda]|uniref:WD_REPEATS_REGION domain-containing protein n=1 Tax=Thelazia callipaeda TaxID=103827 RepID=A0A0N5DB92_THECL|nr:unnamed protein product [Thelazia callipaeda]
MWSFILYDYYSRECISSHLERSLRCPSCGRSLDPKSGPIIFPNFTAASIVDAKRHNMKVARVLTTSGERKEEIEMTKEKLVDLAMNASTSFLDHFVDLLKKRQVSSNVIHRKNILLKEFIDEMITQREEKLKQLQHELSVLYDDKSSMQVIYSILGIVSTYSSLRSKELLVLEHVFQRSLSDNSTVTCSQRMVPDASSVQFSTHISTSKKARFGDDERNDDSFDADDNFDLEMRKYRSRLRRHMADLEQAYFSRQISNTKSEKEDSDLVGSCCDNLDDFSRVLHGISQYGKFRRVSSLNYNLADTSASLSIVSSIEFDKDGEFFILAGVAKRIKLYEFHSVIEYTESLHYPVMQLQCKSKISNVSWNPYCKNMLASSDYDGTVQLWDTSLARSVRHYQVKLWSVGVDRSVATIDAKVNVCCVCFSPTQRNYLVFGSVDHCIHLYDIRKTVEPVNLFRGHRKAVSYVKYCTENEVISASIDSNLRLWDVSSGNCLRTMKGHQNERNFVGLATDGNHIVCGSENNHIFLYHKGLSDPLMSYDFGCLDSGRSSFLATDIPSNFVSAVSWKKDSNFIVAANSQGTTHVFELV